MVAQQGVRLRWVVLCLPKPFLPRIKFGWCFECLGASRRRNGGNGGRVRSPPLRLGFAAGLGANLAQSLNPIDALNGRVYRQD